MRQNLRRYKIFILSEIKTLYIERSLETNSNVLEIGTAGNGLVISNEIMNFLLKIFKSLILFPKSELHSQLQKLHQYVLFASSSPFQFFRYLYCICCIFKILCTSFKIIIFLFIKCLLDFRNIDIIFPLFLIR